MLAWSHYQNWLDPVIASPLPCHLPAPSPRSWCRDSRHIKPGQWYLALKGETSDGHRYISEALSKGAVGFLGEAAAADSLPEAVRLKGILVSDSLTAWQRIGLGWRLEQKNLTLCALTGSVGKTTCKRMLGALLACQGETLCPDDNFNNEIGVPDVLLRLRDHHRFGVLEMGARRPGNIKDLVRISSPNIVACLNAGNTHIEIFGSHQALRETKLEILSHRPPRSVGVVFHDDEILLAQAKAICPDVLTFGRSPEATVCILNETWDDQGGLHIKLRIDQKDIQIVFPKGHDSWSINAAAACAMAYACGMPPEKMGEALASFKNVKGRFDVIKAGSLTLIDDTYNANPASMLSGLKTFKKLWPDKPGIAILGDMLELGEFSASEHYKIGEFCAKNMNLQHLVTVGTASTEIASGALKAGMPEKNLIHFDHVDDFIKAPPFNTQDDYYIYAKGSRGLALDKIIQFYQSLN